MNKLNIILSSIALCVALTTNAQTIQRNVVSAGGTSNTVSNITLTSTVGETFTSTMSSANNSITQGFQQGNLIVARVANTTDEPSNERTEIKEAELTLIVFPNPTTDYVNIVSENETDQLQLTVLDAQGKVIQQLKYDSQKVQIDFTTVAPGTYFIVAVNENGNVKNTYRVIKQN